MDRTYPPGVPCWIDVESPDPDAAAAFYGELLGWRVEPLGGGYRMAFTGDAEVAGLGAGEAGWSTYVATADADRTARAVTEHGGTVLDGPADAGPAGRAATCLDPGGVPFRLWQAGARLGAQLVNAPGCWNFSDLHADDPALDFYTAVFGWRAMEATGAGTMLQVPGYGEHLRTTSDPGILERQANAPEGFADVIGGVAGADADGVARWRVTFNVEDRDAAVATAERLGATVEGTADTMWAKRADLRDPQGAVLTVSQFAPPDDF